MITSLPKRRLGYGSDVLGGGMAGGGNLKAQQMPKPMGPAGGGGATMVPNPLPAPIPAMDADPTAEINPFNALNYLGPQKRRLPGGM